jgi:hypothetical protein
VKYLKAIFSVALVVTAVTMSPNAWADPDPHIPNGAANWCPGGQRPGYGGQQYCLGAQFADGTFYAQTWSFGASGPFAPGAWRSGAMCSQWIEGSIQGAWPQNHPCGGGPQYLN